MRWCYCCCFKAEEENDSREELFQNKYQNTEGKCEDVISTGTSAIKCLLGLEASAELLLHPPGLCWGFRRLGLTLLNTPSPHVLRKGKRG